MKKPTRKQHSSTFVILLLTLAIGAATILTAIENPHAEIVWEILKQLLQLCLVLL